MGQISLLEHIHGGSAHLLPLPWPCWHPRHLCRDEEHSKVLMFLFTAWISISTEESQASLKLFLWFKMLQYTCYPASLNVFLKLCNWSLLFWSQPGAKIFGSMQHSFVLKRNYVCFQAHLLLEQNLSVGHICTIHFSREISLIFYFKNIPLFFSVLTQHQLARWVIWESATSLKTWNRPVKCFLLGKMLQYWSLWSEV